MRATFREKSEGRKREVTNIWKGISCIELEGGPELIQRGSYKKEVSFTELYNGGIMQGGKLEIWIFYISNQGEVFEVGADSSLKGR